jgi:hypothetical protein
LVESAETSGADADADEHADGASLRIGGEV